MASPRPSGIDSQQVQDLLPKANGASDKGKNRDRAMTIILWATSDPNRVAMVRHLPNVLSSIIHSSVQF